jgi:hypothetical protein
MVARRFLQGKWIGTPLTISVGVAGEDTGKNTAKLLDIDFGGSAFA